MFLLNDGICVSTSLHDVTAYKNNNVMKYKDYFTLRSYLELG
jgi:hypothetical protein